MDTSIYFKRKLYDRMLQWKRERNGASALLIQGARRVGKSTLARLFAQNEYASYLMIDFASAPKKIVDLFNDLSDLDYLFTQLQFHYHVVLEPRKSVVIFDEVQKAPLARQAIKYLVADGRYDYIETGSLISVRKFSAGIVIPSEETKVDLYPMDYEEFKWALGDTATIGLLRQAFERRTPLSDAVHRQMMKEFRLYMLVGGMPQAVESYLKTQNLSRVDEVKRDILSLYEEDFLKIDDLGRAKTMFTSIPNSLSQNVSRYQVSTYVPGESATRLATVIQAMEDSKTVNVAYHSNDPQVGLALTRDAFRFKMYTADTGLFVTLAFKSKDFTENIIYEKLLNDKLSANLGYVYENMVAQMLRATGKDLYYHTIPYSGGKKFYEIDFVISDGFKVSPIEVKSSGYRTHASLDAFCQRYSDRIQNRYLVYTKNLKREGGVDYIPIYMTPFL